MTTFLSWFQVTGLVAAGGLLCGVLLSALLVKLFGRDLQEVEPASRLTLLSTLLLLPALGALAAIGIVFLPSLLDFVGLVSDHCHTHPGHHAFHLCFVHSQPPAPSVPMVLGLVAGLGWAVWSWGNTLRGMFRLNRRIRELRNFGSVEQDDSFCRIDTLRPLAMTVGLLSPTVYVSQSLRERLSDAQYRAVLSHEKAHAERFHSLLQLAARFCRPLHLGSTGRALLAEVELACEQVCDRVAADVVGDELSVAEAILAMERESKETPRAALGFGGSAVERRVKAMLNADWRAPNWGLLTGLVLVAATAVLSHYHWLHHAVETWLGMIV